MNSDLNHDVINGSSHNLNFVLPSTDPRRRVICCDNIPQPRELAQGRHLRRQPHLPHRCPHPRLRQRLRSGEGY